MDTAHAEAPGQRRNQGDDDRDGDPDNDQERNSSQQYRGSRLQNRMDYGDDCVEKDHLALGR